ncbi:MAG: DUF721 domain-containing protein [Candidatus Omnitrophica bacterium]|nr:DUF721 domain-containing protein [Candidatus Omnitrophota bacterium]
MPIKDIVNRVIADLSGDARKTERISQEEINRLWKRAAGAAAARRSRPTSLRKGRLIVAVRDSSALYDLTLRKGQILSALTKELDEKIHDIQLRIGEIDGEGKTKNQKPKTSA